MAERERSLVFTSAQLSGPSGTRDKVIASHRDADLKIVGVLRDWDYDVYHAAQDSPYDMRTQAKDAISNEFAEINSRNALFLINSEYTAEGPNANLHYAISIGAFVLIGRTSYSPLQGRAASFVEQGLAQEIIVPLDTKEHFDRKFQSGE